MTKINKKKYLILIPTYNEKKNIKYIINKIKKNLNLNYDLLFIDDNSSDGTKKILKKIKSKKIKIINRKKKLGIGSAHKDGIKYGYKKGYNFIISLDCDGTHDPKHINKMIKLSLKYDLILTNRFTFKNSLAGWNFHRKFITTLRHYLVTMLFNTDLDSSGAFRCYNTKKIKLSKILEAKHSGYFFFTESTIILEKNKHLIKQIPIMLPKRFSGSSKMKISDLIGGFFYMIYLFTKNLISNF